MFGLALIDITLRTASAGCGGYETLSSGEPEFRLMSDKPTLGRMMPMHLGFNLESVPFQLSYWNTANNTVRPAVTDYLRAMSGMVYRYPGGAVSNFVDLNAARGPTKLRQPQRLVDWQPPEPVRFGIPEYADFAALAGGKMWGVLNIYGGIASKLDPHVLASRNREVVRSLRGRGPVLRWEIGNEMYLPKYHTDGSEYAQRILPTLDAMLKLDRTLKPVVGIATFDIGSNKADEFNRQLIRGLAGYEIEFAAHYYYDGKPGGPPVAWATDTLCDKIEKIERQIGKPPSIWITEHARWPPGRAGDKDWKNSWNESNDLSAALSVADFLLAVSQIDAVKGAFLHSLGGAKGPWVLFHESRLDKQIYPSVVLETARLLNAPLSSQVLPTRSRSSSWKSKNLRGVFFRRADNNLGLAAVNRGDASATVRLFVPELAGRKVVALHQNISNDYLHARNTDEAPHSVSLRKYEETLRFDENGHAIINLAGFSISRLDFVAMPN